ncbi:MAG: DUF378 domain-containing protein, partial [Planctomycetota bacterium]
AVLLVIGGLNWGFVGLFGLDLVQTLTGGLSAASTAVYALVGVAALYQVAGLPWIQKRWNVTPRLAQTA